MKISLRALSWAQTSFFWRVILCSAIIIYLLQFKDSLEDFEKKLKLTDDVRLESLSQEVSKKLLTIPQVNLAACTKQNCAWNVSSNCMNIFCVYSDFTNLFLFFLNSDYSLFSDKGWQFSKKEFCDVLLRLHI